MVIIKNLSFYTRECFFLKRFILFFMVFCMMISAFPVSASASYDDGYVTFIKDGSVYVDMTTTQSLGTTEYTIAENITIVVGETVDIVLKQNAMFYNNSSSFSFLGYKLTTKNNNSNGNVTVTLSKENTVLQTVTLLKTTFASAVNNIYVTGDTTINITLSPDTISATVKGSKGTAVLFENVPVSSDGTREGSVKFQTSVTSATYRKLKTVSISSGSTEVKKTSFVMNKVFSSLDTKEKLIADGYVLSNIDTFSDSSGLARHASSGGMKVIYNGTSFGGAHTVEIEAAKAHNEGYVYVNYADSNNYYRITTKSNGATSGTLCIQKIANGEASSLLTDDDGAVVESKAIDMGTNNNMKYVVKLLPDEDNGYLHMTVTLRNSANVARTFTVTDKNSPITSGGAGYANSYVNVSSSKVNLLRSIKVYPGDKAPVVSGLFKNYGAETDEYIPGVTTFGFPVAMIGENPEILAALYNGDKLVNVKSLEISKLNMGDVLLFDEEGTKIKVFTLNSLSGIEPVDFVCQLPIEKTLKLMTYNVKHCENQLTDNIDYKAFAEAIASCNADIVGLNEIRDEGDGLGYDAQTGLLSKYTGLKHYYFAQAITQSGGPYGNGFLSKYPIESAETIVIPDPEIKTGTLLYETRCILKVKLKGGITVMVTHFGLNCDEQENAFATLLENLPDEKCIVMGDFNVRPDNEQLKPLLERMVDVSTAASDELLTHPGDEPTKKLDYIFVTPDIEVISAEVPEILVSDHRPHTAVVSIGEYLD